VVSITAPPDVLAERIATRARRSDGQSAQRLNRIVGGAVAADVTILNVGRPEEHARRFIRIIRGGYASA